MPIRGSLTLGDVAARTDAVVVLFLILACPVGSFAQTDRDATEKTRAMAAVGAAEHTEVFVLDLPDVGAPPCANDRKPLPFVQYLEKYHYPYKLILNPTYNIMVTIYPPHSFAIRGVVLLQPSDVLQILGRQSLATGVGGLGGARRWHQFDRPVRRSAHGVLTMASAQIDRGRGLTTLPAPQLGQHLRERAIAVVPDEQAHWVDRLSATAGGRNPSRQRSRKARCNGCCTAV